MFDVVAVHDDAPERFESVGTKPKFWFDGNGKLFKECRPGTGEDWSEKVAAELAELLGLPHATVDLAVWREKRGIVTPSFVPEGASLVLGNELLGAFIEDYPVNAPGTRQHCRVPQHTLGAIFHVMDWEALRLPINGRLPLDSESPADMFAAYLMFDAWIANTDRHHENWGVIAVPPTDTERSSIHLAPTFDHASCLGRNERDEVRRDRLATKDRRRTVEAYVQKARSAVFDKTDEATPMTTFDTFRGAAQLRPEAAAAWLERFSRITDMDVLELFGQVPRERITDTGVAFACKMLEINQRRLLGLRGELG